MSKGNPAWHASAHLLSLPRLMTRLPIIFAVAVCTFLTGFPLLAQEQRLASPVIIRSLNGQSAGVEYDLKNKTMRGTNGVFIDYEGTVLIADSVFVNEVTSNAVADGSVRIQRDDQIWQGEHMIYNFL